MLVTPLNRLNRTRPRHAQNIRKKRPFSHSDFINCKFCNFEIAALIHERATNAQIWRFSRDFFRQKQSYCILWSRKKRTGASNVTSPFKLIKMHLFEIPQLMTKPSLFCLSGYRSVTQLFYDNFCVLVIMLRRLDLSVCFFLTIFDCWEQKKEERLWKQIPFCVQRTSDAPQSLPDHLNIWFNRVLITRACKVEISIRMSEPEYSDRELRPTEPTAQRPASCHSRAHQEAIRNGILNPPYFCMARPSSSW